MAYHVTPGFNGYTDTSGKQIKAMNYKAEQKALKEKHDKEAEHFAKRYLEDHPNTTQLTGFEIANQHLFER